MLRQFAIPNCAATTAPSPQQYRSSRPRADRRHAAGRLDDRAWEDAKAKERRGRDRLGELIDLAGAWGTNTV